MRDPAAVMHAAERHLQDEVRLVDEVVLDKGSHCLLTIWSDACRLPRRRVAILETEDTVFATSSSMRGFQKLLHAARPDLTDVTLLSWLIKHAAPPRRCVVENEKSFGWLDKYKSIWHPPKLEAGDLVLYVGDFRKGTFERFSISRSHDLEVVVIGPGKKTQRS